ncbi:hypothetical protein R3P38DRAFT_3577189 [Favolaschia claudopus]|uniref:Uncharacterized protein n=1 Tax=Favolaschia claudopus TaxID=2862362 RepID=A0AAW0DQC8_9AGAR
MAYPLEPFVPPQNLFFDSASLDEPKMNLLSNYFHWNCNWLSISTLDKFQICKFYCDLRRELSLKAYRFPVKVRNSNPDPNGMGAPRLSPISFNRLASFETVGSGRLHSGVDLLLVHSRYQYPMSGYGTLHLGFGRPMSADAKRRDPGASDCYISSRQLEVQPGNTHITTPAPTCGVVPNLNLGLTRPQSIEYLSLKRFEATASHQGPSLRHGRPRRYEPFERTFGIGHIVPSLDQSQSGLTLGFYASRCPWKDLLDGRNVPKSRNQNEREKMLLPPLPRDRPAYKLSGVAVTGQI